MRYEPFLVPETLADIRELIQDEVQENIHLDYKDSRAMRKPARDEIAKDVSAFANSDGGVLIYGVQEKDNLPTNMDNGVADAEITREWIEAAIMTRITPRVDIKITPLPVTAGRTIYVITVPKALRGPHQASDKKYYKRHNFSSEPMEDYEIADIRNRRSAHPSIVSFRPDIYAGCIIVFDVENIGTTIAHDLQFTFSEELPWPNGRPMPPPLRNGIAHLHPRQRLRFLYFPSWEIFNGTSRSPMQFTVRVSYTHGDTNLAMADEWPIDLRMYDAAMAVDSDEQAYRNKMIKAVESIAKHFAKASNAPSGR